MDEMLGLLGDHPPCLLFEQLFLERLPEDIRIQLVDSKIEDYSELARRADALWSSRDMESVHAIKRGPSVGQKETKSKAPSPSPDNRLCYYHRRFGKAARQCRQPDNLALGRETKRPVASDGHGGRPEQWPTLRLQRGLQTTISRRYRSRG